MRDRGNDAGALFCRDRQEGLGFHFPQTAGEGPPCVFSVIYECISMRNLGCL